MYKSKNLILIYIIAILFIRCNHYSPELTEVLVNSGSNRSELDKVLSYYDKDSEKYEIAKFLILNSQYHYALLGKEVDSIKDALTSADKYGVIDSIKHSKWRSFKKFSLKKKEDLRELKADYLIKNIELAHKVWKEKPWNKNLSISDFCEYILPYRINDEEIDNWRELYYNTFNSVLDSLYQGDDVLVAATKLLTYLQKEYSYNFTWVLEYPHLGGEFLLNNRVGKCRDACDFITYVFRSVGIPIACDFYTYSPETRKGHIWNSIKTKHGWLPFNYPYTLPQKGFYQIDSRSPSTIYRQRFSAQMNESQHIPSLFNNSLMDNVSKDYFRDSSFVLKSNSKITYVGVFGKDSWVPIAYAKNDKEIAIFNNLGPNQIYIQLEYQDSAFTPTDNPFVFDGVSTRYFIPDTLNRISCNLNRKFPLSQRVKTFMNDMKGGSIWIKNINNNFIEIFKIDTIHDGYNSVKFNPEINLNQIKYISPENGTAQIAEFHVYYLGEERIPLSIKGESPATQGTFEWQLNDNNPLSYFISTKRGASILFDFGTEIKVDSISFIPRTDENWIRIGDIYELYYCNRGKWISLEVKKADDKELVYDNIPQGALLYLHNKTRGEEELPFYIEDDKQVFISKAID